MTYQNPDILNTEYLDQFKAFINIIDAYSGTPGAHPGLTNDVLVEMPGVDMSTYPSGVTNDQAKAAKNTAREKYLACIFISGAWNIRYGAINRDFHN